MAEPTKRRLTATEKRLDGARREFEHDRDRFAMEILHEEGPYRHLRLRIPDSHDWFDLVTWPKNVLYSSGGIAFAFCPGEDDVLALMARVHHVSPSYWAKHLKADRDTVLTYDEDLLHEQLNEEMGGVYEGDREWRLTRAAERLGFHDAEQLVTFARMRMPSGEELTGEDHEAREAVATCHRQTRAYMRALRAAVNDQILDPWGPYCGAGWENGARLGLRDFRFQFDEETGLDEPEFEFTGWEEWTLRDWDWNFMRAVRRMLWGARHYTAMQAEKVQVAG